MCVSFFFCSCNYCFLFVCHLKMLFIFALLFKMYKSLFLSFIYLTASPHPSTTFFKLSFSQSRLSFRYTVYCFHSRMCHLFPIYFPILVFFFFTTPSLCHLTHSFVGEIANKSIQKPFTSVVFFLAFSLYACEHFDVYEIRYFDSKSNYVFLLFRVEYSYLCTS